MKIEKWELDAIASYTAECKAERAMFEKFQEQDAEVSEYEIGIWNKAIEAAAKCAEQNSENDTAEHKIRKLKK
jgi:hypothetical protein